MFSSANIKLVLNSFTSYLIALEKHVIGIQIIQYLNTNPLIHISLHFHVSYNTYFIIISIDDTPIRKLGPRKEENEVSYPPGIFNQLLSEERLIWATC